MGARVSGLLYEARVRANEMCEECKSHVGAGNPVSLSSHLNLTSTASFHCLSARGAVFLRCANLPQCLPDCCHSYSLAPSILQVSPEFRNFVN